MGTGCLPPRQLNRRITQSIIAHTIARQTGTMWFPSVRILVSWKTTRQSMFAANRRLSAVTGTGREGLALWGMHRVQDKFLGGLWQLRCTRSLYRTNEDLIPRQVPRIISESQALSRPVATSDPPRFVIPTSHFMGDGRRGEDIEDTEFSHYMTTIHCTEHNNAPSLGHHTDPLRCQRVLHRQLVSVHWDNKVFKLQKSSLHAPQMHPHTHTHTHTVRTK